MSLNQTTIRYHFVGHVGSNDDLDMLRKLAWKDGAVTCFMHTWVWPLYCQLRDRGLPVSFGYRPRHGAINFIHGQIARHQLKAADIRNYFIVGIRADFRPFPYGNFEVVQNQKTMGGKRIYMPHFPQPGLVPRDGKRSEVVNICAAGEPQNFVDIDSLRDELEKIDCRFVFKAVGEWQNMSDVDILLGIRSFSKCTYDSKPPTKLFNAWLARIPFIGGYDSAYEQVGTPGIDYLKVSSSNELVDAIKELKYNKTRYNSLVEEGTRSAVLYSPRRITDRWLDFLKKDVEPAFLRWIQRSLPSRIDGLSRSICFEIIEKQLRGFKRSDVWE